jgi:hypothetical protein
LNLRRRRVLCFRSRQIAPNRLRLQSRQTHANHRQPNYPRPPDHSRAIYFNINAKPAETDAPPPTIQTCVGLVAF